MSEKTCATCRWWNTAEEYVWDTKPDQTYDCERISSGRAGRHKARIYPVAGGGWLSTRPDFGCVLHEEKPPSKDSPPNG